MKLIGRPTVYRLQWAQPRTEAVALFVLGVLWLGTFDADCPTMVVVLMNIFLAMGSWAT